MTLDWQPYSFDADARRAELMPLFQAGIERDLPAAALCKMAADIAGLSPHDGAVISTLSETLIGAAPNSSQAWSFRTQSLRMFGDRDDAIAACEKGLGIEPDNPDLLMQKASLLMGVDRHEEACAVLQSLANTAPGLAAVPLCECLIKLDRIGEAQDLLQARAAEAPLTTPLLTMRYLCDALTGNSANSSLRDNALIAEITDAPVMCSIDAAQLNEALAEAIKGSDAMRPDPANTATVNGGQGFLNEVLPQQLAESVIAMIQANIETYVRDRSSHGYIARRPATLSITSWAVSLTQGGHQAAHTHPAGWLSGVYYVDVGDSVPGANNAGAIEFWKPPEYLTGNQEFASHMIQPHNGMMLVFPSYAYHGTIPHASDQPRLSIAFDIG